MNDLEAKSCEDQPAGPPRSWPATVEAMLGPVYRFVRARAPADAVDDIVQETFVAASRGIGRFDGRCPVWNWLVTIARNTIANHYRRRGSRDLLTESLAILNSDGARVERALLSESSLPDEICERREFKTLAQAALTALPPEQQDYLVARYYEDLSLDEMARRFGVSPSSANTRLFRAREALRRVFPTLLAGQVDDQECVP